MACGRLLGQFPTYMVRSYSLKKFSGWRKAVSRVSDRAVAELGSRLPSVSAVLGQLGLGGMQPCAHSAHTPSTCAIATCRFYTQSPCLADSLSIHSACTVSLCMLYTVCAQSAHTQSLHTQSLHTFCMHSLSCMLYSLCTHSLHTQSAHIAFAHALYIQSLHVICTVSLAQMWLGWDLKSSVKPCKTLELKLPVLLTLLPPSLLLYYLPSYCAWPIPGLPYLSREEMKEGFQAHRKESREIIQP